MITFAIDLYIHKSLKYLGVSPVRGVSPIEVLAFEVEVGTFDKHNIGSVLNLAKISERGV